MQKFARTAENLTYGVCKYYIGTIGPIGLKYYIGPSAVFLC